MAIVGSDDGMQRKRRKRCPYCGELFWPNRRTAWRQWACSKDCCQTQRRRETQRRYRAKNSGEREAQRYRAAIAQVKDEANVKIWVPAKVPFLGNPIWDEIKDEIGVQLCVTLMYFAKLIFVTLEDEITKQSAEIHEESSNYGSGEEKDEMGARVLST